MPDGNGVELCRDLRSQLPELRCLILTSYSDDEALSNAIMAGASGFVLKQVVGNDLISAVRKVGAGESLLDAKTTEALMKRIRQGETTRPAGRADRPGAGGVRPGRRGADQPPDRGPPVPRGEDGQELRLPHPGEAGHAATDTGGGAGERS